MNQAYSNFFSSCKGERKGQKVRPPKFKKRKSGQSARFTRGGFKVGQHNVKLAKIGKVKIVWSRELPSEPSSVTVIKDSADRYFLSFVVEIIPDPSPLAPLSKGGKEGGMKSCGIDLGITDFATFDDGEKVKAPKPLKKNLKRLRKCQKQRSRKKKGSKRREVARKKVAKLHASLGARSLGEDSPPGRGWGWVDSPGSHRKIKDVRTDFLHKLSTKVIRENQSIALEDLNVSGMVKNRKLSRAISDLGWREFRTMLNNKADKYGREFHVIDRWEATTQTCSNCSEKGGKKDLSVRE